MTAWRRRLASNALANYAGQITTVGVGILLTPILLRDLQPSLYGVWVLVVSIQGLGGILDLGIGSSVVKYVAQHEALGEIDERNRVLSTTLALNACLGVVAFSVLVVVAMVLLPVLGLGRDLDEARTALLVAAVGLLLALPLRVPGGILTALRRYEVSNFINIVQAISTAVVIAVALDRAVGPAGLIGISTVGSLLAYVAKWAYAARLLPDLHIRPGLVGPATLRRIGGYSGWLFLIDTGKSLFYNADAVLLAAFLPIAAIGTYNLGFKPASAVSYLSGPLVSVFVPTASALDARSEVQSLQRLLLGGTRAAIALTLVGSVWLAAFGGQLLELWVGPGHGDALPVLWVFLAVFVVSSFQNPAGAILRGIGQVRTFSVVVAVEYGANIVLSIALIPSLGIVGAAVGTLLPAIVNDLVVIPWLACRQLGLDYRSLLASTLPAPVGAAALELVVLVLLSRWLPQPSLIIAGVGALVGLLVFAVPFSRAGMSGDERRIVRREVSSMMGRIRARAAQRPDRP